MSQTILVVSSVHPADDTRIRHKLIETLRGVADVRYATRQPGPVDSTGISVELLEGSRWHRILAASRRILGRGYDLVSVHDPELLPAAMIAGVLRRRVVFDVHEDIPAQLRTKRWLPGPLGLAAGWIAAGVLRVAERLVEITLAEPNYAGRFGATHPVFPNYLVEMPVAFVPPRERRGVVYLGDISEIRGAVTAVRAVGAAAGNPALTMIGRCPAALQTWLEAEAQSAGMSLTLTGFLPPEQALTLVAQHAVALSPLHDVPNYRASLPTKLLEYLALGIPVVASDLPGSRKGAADLDGIVWVTPGDSAALARGIDLALTSPSLTLEATAGVPDVRRRYRWPAEEVRKFYVGE